MEPPTEEQTVNNNNNKRQRDEDEKQEQIKKEEGEETPIKRTKIEEEVVSASSKPLPDIKIKIKIKKEEPQEEVVSASSKPPPSQPPRSSSSKQTTKNSHRFSYGETFTHPRAERPEVIERSEGLQAAQEDEMLSRYVHVNPQQMAICHGLAMRDVDLAMASDYIITAMIAGGISFSFAGKRVNLHNDKKEEKETREDRYLSGLWRTFVTKFWKCMWEYGFVAVTYNKDQRIPLVMPLTDTDTYVFTSQMGERRWVHRLRSNGSVGGMNLVQAVIDRSMKPQQGEGGGDKRQTSQGPMAGIMPNVMTFCDFPPAPDGSLQSPAMMLWPYIQQLETRRNLISKAEIARVNPVHFIVENKQSSNMRASEGTNLQKPKDGDGNNEGKTTEEIEDRKRMMLDQIRLRAQYQTMQQQIASYEEEARLMGGQRIRIPTGFDVKAATMPEVPTDQTMASIEQTERVLRVMGIPPPLLMIKTTNGHASLNESVQASFHPKVRYLKDQTVVAIEDVWHWMNDMHLLSEAALNMPALERVNEDEVTHFEVSLAGIPDDNKIERLYEMGVLTYQAYCRHKKVNDSLSFNDFNPEPKPPQTVWQPPPAPTATATSKGAAVKSKSTSKTKPKTKTKQKTK